AKPERGAIPRGIASRIWAPRRCRIVLEVIPNRGTSQETDRVVPSRLIESFSSFQRGWGMTYRGTLRSGVIGLSADVTLPGGMEVVVVVCEAEPASPTKDGVWVKLADLGRWTESQPSDLPPDLAENHDHYLHGHPKHQ